MLSMQMIWTHIEVEFKILHASALWREFQPGASEADIQETESFLGITFPDEVKASYLLHNGSNGKELIGDPHQGTYQLYSLAKIMRDWQQEMDRQSRLDPPAYPQEEEGSKVLPLQRGNYLWWWHPRWIPLLQDGSGVWLCLDLAPGPAGQVGQIIQLDVETGKYYPSVVASSWQSLLLTFAQDLEAGEYSLFESIYGDVFLMSP
ncbi:MAG TPA: SMI1/KNR4 family protein [Ktedonobacteraceae bacterium]|nr:SMI1/KNR4 family protein [Ktedonobacteraceae bacterium]